MKQKLKRLSLLLVLCLGLSGLKAQESTNATGGDASGNGGSADYSVGQVVYQTHTGNGGSAAEGVELPFEIYVTTGIKKARGITLSVSVFPNPTVSYLILSVDGSGFSDLIYRLYDIDGKIIQSNKITGSQTEIIVDGLVPATYFMKVVRGNKEVKTFKIIKN